MHERISMLFFQRLGVHASREAFTRLYVNNVYSGLYSIVESVDKAFLARTLGENGGYLYKYDYAAGDPPYYFENRGSNPDAYVPKPFKPETHETDPLPERIVELIRIVNDSDLGRVPLSGRAVRAWDQFIKHIAIENFLADQDGFNGSYGQQPLLVSVDEQEPVHVGSVGQERIVQGWSLPAHLPQLLDTAGEQNRLSARARNSDESAEFVS